MGEADPYRELYLPLMLSMTLGQPGAYWDARYGDELGRVNAARLQMEETLKSATRAQGNAQATAPAGASHTALGQAVQTALDELYAWYGLPATVLSITTIAGLPLSTLMSVAEVRLTRAATTDPILDVGTGNGHVCELLRLAGRRNLTGSDARYVRKGRA